MIRRSKVRIRTRSGSVNVKAISEKAVKEALTEYKRLDNQIADLVQQQAVLREEIERSMVRGKLSSVFDGLYTAKYEAPATRSTRTVDPEKFSDLVDAETFWKCVSIPVKAAQEVLTERELADVSTVKDAEKKPPVLTITRKKT